MATICAMATKKVDPEETREAVHAIRAWLADATLPTPSRQALALACRTTARTLAEELPGHTVELRVPPFVAVQCVEGPRHTRGTPPNVVETDPRTWLRLATGLTDLETEVASGNVEASGSRAGEVARGLPVIPL